MCPPAAGCARQHPLPAEVTGIGLTWCTKTSTGGSSATPARAVMDRKPNPMRTLNHLQMPAPCSSCGSSAARAASAGASSGALAQPPGDGEGAQLGGHGAGGPLRGRAGRPERLARGWTPRRLQPQAAGDERRVPATARAPQAHTEASGAPKVLLPFPTTRCPGTDRRTGPSSSLPLPPSPLCARHWDTSVLCSRDVPMKQEAAQTWGSFRQPGGHFPASLLSGCFAPLQPRVSPISNQARTCKLLV